MKKFLLFCAVSAFGLAGASYSPYLSVSGGGAAQNLNESVPLFCYSFMTEAKDISPGQEFLDNPTRYESHLVEVRSKDLIGAKFNGAAGVLINGTYRLEIEGTFVSERKSVTHYCKSLQRIDTNTLHHRTWAACFNVGGHFPELLQVVPYSMVGMGLVHAPQLEGEDKSRFCYQWISGGEKNVSEHLSLFVHHKYRKAFRADSLHCIEAGVKFSM